MPVGTNQVVYVSGLPYEWTEDQLRAVAETIGPVSRVDIIMDNARHKSKGFGFIGFQSAETAKKALTQLPDLKIGKTRLRVRPSTQSSAHAGHSGGHTGTHSGGHSGNANGTSSNPYAPPQLPYQQPQYQQYPPLQNTQFPISQNTPRPFPMTTGDRAPSTPPQVPVPTLIELFAKLKIMLSTDAASASQASQILVENPEVTQALVRSLLVMGFVDENVISKAVQQHAALNSNSNLSSSTSHLPSNVNLHPSSTSIPTSSRPRAHPSGGANGNPITPRVAEKLRALDKTQAQLIKEVLLLSMDQVDALPLEQKATVQELRRQFLEN